jgi:hypothetical protein
MGAAIQVRWLTDAPNLNTTLPAGARREVKFQSCLLQCISHHLELTAKPSNFPWPGRLVAHVPTHPLLQIR